MNVENSLSKDTTFFLNIILQDFREQVEKSDNPEEMKYQFQLQQ